MVDNRLHPRSPGKLNYIERESKIDFLPPLGLADTNDSKSDVRTSLLGVVPRNLRAFQDGELVATEQPFNHIKQVGRQYSNLDNMDRKFKVKGYSTNLDLWDMQVIADSQSIGDDAEFLKQVKRQQQSELRDFYN